MLPANEREMKDLTAVLKALAEPNRMRIFAELMQGDSCNCELQERLELAPNLVYFRDTCNFSPLSLEFSSKSAHKWPQNISRYRF